SKGGYLVISFIVCGATQDANRFSPVRRGLIPECSMFGQQPQRFQQKIGINERTRAEIFPPSKNSVHT
ncbi:MAG: hypothetical protein AAGF26_03480, partial [Cyanobacteria bacterium P01_G01_bin.49]